MSRLMTAVAHGTVITVDDEADILDVMNCCLRKAGLEVHGASSYDELIMYVHELHCDVIVMDICMSDRDGIWVAEKLRAESIRTPIVFVSGYDSADVRLRASVIPNTRFVRKPFDPDEFVEAVLASMRGKPDAAHENIPG